MAKSNAWQCICKRQFEEKTEGRVMGIKATKQCVWCIDFNLDFEKEVRALLCGLIWAQMDSKR